MTVATILAGLGADDQTLCAAMLHDTVEDTPYTLTALSREFGPDIAVMVARSMALDGVKWRGGRKVARVITAVGSAEHQGRRHEADGPAAQHAESQSSNLLRFTRSKA